jgi:hypothetical protein
MTIVAGPKSRWARRQKVKLSELADELWILPWSDTKVGGVIADAFRARGVRFPPKGVSWGAASLMCAVLPRGNCLGTLPASTLQFGLNLPRLKVLSVDLPVEHPGRLES